MQIVNLLRLLKLAKKYNHHERELMAFDGVAVICHRITGCRWWWWKCTVISLWPSSLEQNEITALMTSGFCRMEIWLAWKVKAAEGSKRSVSRSTLFFIHKRRSYNPNAHGCVGCKILLVEGPQLVTANGGVCLSVYLTRFYDTVTRIKVRNRHTYQMAPQKKLGKCTLSTFFSIAWSLTGIQRE